MTIFESGQLLDGKIRLRSTGGWCSMFSSKGQQLLVKVTDAETASLAVDGMAAIADMSSQLAKELAPGGAEEKVFTVTMNKKPCELRVGGMNLTVMKGPKFHGSYQYTELNHWEYTNKGGNNQTVTIYKKDDTKEAFMTTQAQEICDLMTAHAVVVAEKQRDDRKLLMQEMESLADSGEILGLYKASKQIPLREGKELDSEESGQFEAGDLVQVLESCLLPSRKIRLRCTGGWCSMFSSKGYQLLVKVTDAEVASLGADGMAAIADISSQLAKELAPGGAEEKVFTVTMNKKPCELRVGGMNLTVMDGPNFVASYQYTELASWSCKGMTKGTDMTLVINKKDKSKVVFKTTTAETICDLMTAHAQVVADTLIDGKRRQHHQEMKQLATDGELVGLFKADQKLPVRNQLQASPEEDHPPEEVSYIVPGETVKVLECCLSSDDVICLRCHLGWVDMFSGSGEELMVKVTDAEADSVAVGGMSAIAELSSQLAKELAPGGAEEKVFAVTMNKKPCELRVGGMNLTVMDGPKFVASYQYSDLIDWNVQSKGGKDQSLTIYKKAKGKVVFKTSEGQEIDDLMTINSNLVNQKKIEEQQELARAGQCLGPYKASQKVQARETQELSSGRAGQVQSGQTTKVLECCVLPDGKIRLRCDGVGWVSMFSSHGVQLMTKVDAAAPARQSSKRGGRRRASVTGFMTGSSIAMAAFQKELQEADIDDMPVQQMYHVRQSDYKKWPKHLKFSAGSVGITIFGSDDKLVATFLYANLKNWSHAKDRLTFILNAKYIESHPSEPKAHTLTTSPGEAEQISALLTKNAVALNDAKIKSKEEDRKNMPVGIWQCTGPSTVRSTFERTSSRVGRIQPGVVVEVADAQKNHDSQWRFRIGRMWKDETLEKTLDRLVDEEGNVTMLADLRVKRHGWTSVATSDRINLFKHISDTVPEHAADDIGSSTNFGDSSPRTIPKAIIKGSELYEVSSVRGGKTKLKAKKGDHIQLQLGGMGLQLLHKGVVVDTYLYQLLENCKVGRLPDGSEEDLNNGYFEMGVKGTSDPLRFVTSRLLAKEIKTAVAEKLEELPDGSAQLPESEQQASDSITEVGLGENSAEGTDTEDEMMVEATDTGDDTAEEIDLDMEAGSQDFESVLDQDGLAERALTSTPEENAVSETDEGIDQPTSEGVVYKARAASMVRVSPAMDSAKAEPEKLKIGDEIVVLETVELEDGTVR
eukprot:COSAG02_NODE_6033_length_3857_cov_9.226450_1_plen_1215_part_01